MLIFYPLLHTQAVHFAFFTFQRCIFYEVYFTGRTNSYNLGNPRTVYYCPSSRAKCFVSYYIPVHRLLLVFSFIFRDIKLVSSYI